MWVDIVSTAVVANYSLSAHAVPREEAPNRIGRGVPDPVPAALLAKPALDRSLHGMRLGFVPSPRRADRMIVTAETIAKGLLRD